MLTTRFAPTPSGFLHRGNAFSFVLTWLIARAKNGKIILRIDDLDTARTRPEYVDDIFETLDYLGLDWDEGAQNTADFFANHSQHFRLERYQDALEELKVTGKLFACTCSRKEIRQKHPKGLYLGMCREKKLPFDAPNTAWRFLTDERTTLTVIENPDSSLKKVNLYREMPDFVVRQKNGMPAYMIASVVDDVDLGVNFIVRGADLWRASAAQLALAREIESLRMFSETAFYHHNLILEKLGKKLSKSEGSAAIRTMREKGIPPDEIFVHASQYLNLPPRTSAQALLKIAREMSRF